MSNLLFALASDPDFVLDAIRDNPYPERPVPCYACGKADPADPAWRIVLLANGDRRGCCDRCWARADMDVTEPLGVEWPSDEGDDDD